MPLYEIEGKRPKLNGGGQFIAPNASVIGDVQIGTESSIWFNVTIRAENDQVLIGDRSNIQDGCVLHVDPGFPLEIGQDVTIGHKVMLHGCSIGDGSLIGMNSVVLNGAKIGSGALIGANALVTENMDVPDGALVLGSPAKVVKILPEERQLALKKSAEVYVVNAKRYNQTLLEIVE